MSDTPKVGADRAGIMERYHEAVGLPKVDSEVTPAPAEAEASSDSANNQSQSDAQPSKEPTDKAPQQPIAKEVVNDPGVKKDVEKPEDTKMVPLGALHEAREKYKAKKTHESLTKEGYPGFGRFVRDVYDALKVKVDSESWN
jgi:hypothetical protein